MRYFYTLLVILFLAGCSPMTYLDDLPNTSFGVFEYNRAGNVTSAHILAENGIMEHGTLLVEKVLIKADYGPFINFSVRIEDFERTTDDKETKE